MRILTWILNQINKSPRLSIFLILLTVFFFTASGNIDSIDGSIHITMGREFALHRRFDLNEKVQAQALVIPMSKQTGKFYSYYNFGYSLFFVPGAIMSIAIRNFLHVPLPTYPLEPDWIIIMYANMVNGMIVALIGVVVYSLLQLIQDKKPSSKFVLLIPLLILSTHFFIEAHDHFPHVAFTLFFLLSFYYLIKSTLTNTKYDFFKSSVLFAITASIYNATFILLLPGLYIFFQLSKIHTGTKNVYIRLFYFCLFALPSFIVQGIWNYIRYRNIFITGYAENINFSMNDIFSRSWGMSFAPNIGFFLHNPIMLIVVITIIIEIFKNTHFRNIYILFCVLFLSYVFGYSTSFLWHGSSVYGPRFLTPILPIGILILCFKWNTFSFYIKKILLGLILIGFIIQIPGILIPNFAFPFLSPNKCGDNNKKYYQITCSPIKVGWSNLLKRRIKETIITLGEPLSKNEVSFMWPTKPKPFRTIYPDPLFDKFSELKIDRYKIKDKVLDDIYSFALDIWWIKLKYYRNI